jgi:hypothetical protein
MDRSAVRFNAVRHWMFSPKESSYARYPARSTMSLSKVPFRHRTQRIRMKNPTPALLWYLNEAKRHYTVNNRRGLVRCDEFKCTVRENRRDDESCDLIQIEFSERDLRSKMTAVVVVEHLFQNESADAGPKITAFFVTANSLENGQCHSECICELNVSVARFANGSKFRINISP